MKPKTLAAIGAVAALLVLGIWKFALRGPPDITEAEAKALADKQLDIFCDTMLKPLPSPAPGKPEGGGPALPGPGGPGSPGAGAPPVPGAGFMIPGSAPAHCFDFKLTGKDAPTSKRYFWAWAYENVKVLPAQRVLAMIGKKGEATFEVSMFAPPEPQAAGAAASKASGAAPPAIGLSRAPSPKPVEAVPGWTLCELPPVRP